MSTAEDRAGYDLAVVGAGIVGLGHALAALRRGLSVVVVDRASQLTGATIRNFGHIGTSAHAGEAVEYARRSREIWLQVAAPARLWVRESGTLMVAAHDDELAVLGEAHAEHGGRGRLLSAAEVAELAPVVGAKGGLLRADDLQVDPRQAGPALATWLERVGVEFRWSTTATGVETGVLHTSRGPVRADTVVFAVNFDVDQLFPDVAERHRVERCGLDMLLADGVGLQVPLLTGSSMLRYSAFASMPSAPEMRARLQREQPEIFERDVNQMYTERPDGTLVVGDTHYTAATVTPFQDESAFDLLQRLAERLFGRPLAVRQRWQGVYAKAPGDFLRVAPADGVRIVSVTSGIGMTTGLGLAESVIDELFGDR